MKNITNIVICFSIALGINAFCLNLAFAEEQIPQVPIEEGTTISLPPFSPEGEQES